MSPFLKRVVPSVTIFVASIYLRIFFYLLGLYFLTTGIGKISFHFKTAGVLFLFTEVMNTGISPVYMTITGILDLLFAIGILAPMFRKADIISWGAILTSAVYLLILMVIAKLANFPVNYLQLLIVLLFALAVTSVTWALALHPSMARTFEAVASIRRALFYFPVETNWAAQLQPPAVGEMAVDFELPDYKGENSFRLSDYKGKRAVALIFGTYT